MWHAVLQTDTLRFTEPSIRHVLCIRSRSWMDKFQISLFSHQVRAQALAEDGPSTETSQSKKIFGISTSSRIGWIISSYLHLIPSIANDEEKMAETTELYDRWLKLELLDHYERMTTKKRMSSTSMQQWLAGAAVHVHIRIHQVSAEKRLFWVIPLHITCSAPNHILWD